MKQLAEDFIDVSLLTNKSINVTLIEGKLKMWKVTFTNYAASSSVYLNLECWGSGVEAVQSTSPELEIKLFEMAHLVWNSCNTIYKFVIVTYHIIVSGRPVMEEIFFLSRTVHDLTNDL